MYKLIRIVGALCLGVFLLGGATKEERVGTINDDVATASLGNPPGNSRFAKSRLDKTVFGARIYHDKGESLAKISLASVRGNSKSMVLRTLASLDLMKEQFVDVDVEIVDSKVMHDGSSRIRFKQSIHGVPVQRINEVIVGAKGDVSSAKVGLVEASKVDPRELAVREKEARFIALRQVEIELADPKYNISFAEDATVKLSYQLVGEEFAVVPMWKIEGIRIEAEGEPILWWSASVNGLDRAVKVFPTFHGNNVGAMQTRVCEPFIGTRQQCDNYTTINGGWPPIPVTWTYHQVYAENTSGTRTCVAVVSGRCGNAKYTEPWDTAQEFEDFLQSKLPPTQCCENTPDYDILTEPKISVSGPEYNASKSTVVIPKPSQMPTSDFEPVDAGQFPDVVTHEVFHHIQKGLNPDLLAQAAAGGGTVDKFGRAVLEGIADVAAATFAKSQGASDANAYKIGEGVLKPHNVRDLSVNRKFNDITSSSSPNMNAQVIGNFFYRLKGKGLSEDTILQLATHITDQIFRDGATYDADDFKRAADSFSMNPAIQNAIDSTMLDMEYMVVGNPPPSGGGSGTPSTPFIFGSFSHCASGFTVSSISWSAVSGATNYKVYAYEAFGGLGFKGNVSGTSTFINTNYSTSWFTRACNSSGCSDYSNGYGQFHSCE